MNRILFCLTVFWVAVVMFFSVKTASVSAAEPAGLLQKTFHSSTLPAAQQNTFNTPSRSRADDPSASQQPAGEGQIGGLIGTLIFGREFNGITMFDIIVIGLIAFLLFRFLRSTGTRDYTDEADADVDAQEAAERYKRAQAAWDHLRSDKPAGGQASSQVFGKEHGPDYVVESGVQVPQDFDVQDFIKGAKIVYARIRESFDSGDLDDIGYFTTERLHDEFKTLAAAQVSQQKSEIVLINAKLLDVGKKGEIETASVEYEVLLRPDSTKDKPSKVTEIWRFEKDTQAAGAKWLAADIRKVSGAASTPIQ